jgi:hypothetical protein
MDSIRPPEAHRYLKELATFAFIAEIFRRIAQLFSERYSPFPHLRQSRPGSAVRLPKWNAIWATALLGSRGD